MLRREFLGKWAVKDSNLRSRLTTDLQSVPFGHLGNRPQMTCVDPLNFKDQLFNF